ncbi:MULTISPECIES: hypothetical protein [unclassified Streptomyces]|uniref:hypothetical protein n=1 Tax=unclassified Streptomyces TaxID=2593676 RepID=UPI00244242C7|nr:hypothetical protein [Streptomyces sp. DH41]MDG9728459.1 hypothetical protein [Streptomyces sp. DH41]
MKIVIEGASPEFERKLLALLADHRHELAVSVDTEWDTDRAFLYLLDLPAKARRFVQLVVEADGDKNAEELRAAFDGELRGPTIALSRAVPRGVRKGWWPEGTRAPIAPRYDPEHPSWQKAIAYTMTREDTAIFQTVFQNMADGTVSIPPGLFGGTTVRRDGEEQQNEEEQQ